MKKLNPVTFDRSQNQPVISRFSPLAQIASISHQQEVECQSRKTNDDEVNLYLKNFARSSPTDTTDAIEFWKVHQNEFPRLSNLAFDPLPIPATSAAVECVFSQAGPSYSEKKMPNW